MALYFLTFLCHRLFEALFVEKTWERHHPLFTYCHLLYEANFAKLAEVDGTKIAKGTAKQKATKPGGPSSWLSLITVSDVELFPPWDHWAAQELVLRTKISAVSVAIALAFCPMQQWRHNTVYWNSLNILLSWGFGVFFSSVYEGMLMPNECDFYKYSDMGVDASCCIRK